jgi:predicted Fe-Mo cluster-binding NifX family protein
MRMKRLMPVIVVVSVLLAGLAHAASDRKIAVAAEAREASSMVASVAARSPWYLIFDEDGNLLEAVQNPYRTSRGRAAASVLELLSEKAVTVFVAGAFGERMVQGMEKKGMRRLEFSGSVREALKKALER